MDCVLVILAKSTALKRTRKGGKGGRGGRQNNCLKLGCSVTLTRRRTKRHRAGLGVSGSLLTPAQSPTEASVQLSMLEWRERATIPDVRGGGASFPCQLLSLHTAGSRGSGFSSFVLLQCCPSLHCWVTQPGGLL